MATVGVTPLQVGATRDGRGNCLLKPGYSLEPKRYLSREEGLNRECRSTDQERNGRDDRYRRLPVGIGAGHQDQWAGGQMNRFDPEFQ